MRACPLPVTLTSSWGPSAPALCPKTTSTSGDDRRMSVVRAHPPVELRAERVDSAGGPHCSPRRTRLAGATLQGFVLMLLASYLPLFIWADEQLAANWVNIAICNALSARLTYPHSQQSSTSRRVAGSRICFVHSRRTRTSSSTPSVTASSPMRMRAGRPTPTSPLTSRRQPPLPLGISSATNIYISAVAAAKAPPTSSPAIASELAPKPTVAPKAAAAPKPAPQRKKAIAGVLVKKKKPAVCTKASPAADAKDTAEAVTDELPAAKRRKM
jgi:hypothetical protein